MFLLLSRESKPVYLYRYLFFYKQIHLNQFDIQYFYRIYHNSVTFGNLRLRLLEKRNFFLEKISKKMKQEKSTYKTSQKLNYFWGVFRQFNSSTKKLINFL